MPRPPTRKNPISRLGLGLWVKVRVRVRRDGRHWAGHVVLQILNALLNLICEVKG